MHKLLAVVGLAVSVCTPLAVAAGDGQPLSLNAALRLALERNPAYRDAVVGVTAAEARARAARAPLGPRVVISDSYQYADPVAELATSFGPLPFSPPSTNVPLVGVELLAYDGGARLASLGAAEADVAAARGAQRQAASDVVGAVAKAYFGLAAARESTAVADHAVDLAQQHLELAQQRFHAGVVARADVLQAETDLAARRVDAIDAANAVELAQNDLDAAINVPFATTYVPSDGLDVPSPTLDLGLLVAQGLRARGDLAAARAAVDAAAKALAAARATRAPHVSVGVSEGNVQPVVTTGFKAQFSAQLRAVWTLFDGGTDAARIAEAQAAVRRAELAVEALSTKAELEVRQAYLRVTASRARVDAANQLMDLAAENERLAEIRYRAGVGTALELRDAELRDTEARRTQVTAQADLRSNVVAVQVASGQVPIALMGGDEPK